MSLLDQLEEGRYLIPPHMWNSVTRYFINHIAPGGFLTAVLSNQLMEAFDRADDVNAAAMRDWCAFLYNYAPSSSYGSPELFSQWVKEPVP